jgi:predicted porin
VVGVENTEYPIFHKSYADQYTAEEYAALLGTEYADYPDGTSASKRPYKSTDTGKRAQNIRLAAQYDTSNPEDVSFAASTPSGTMTFYCDNPSVVDTFVPGTNYYLDLTPCE